MDEEDKKEDEEQQGMMAKAMHYWRIISHSLRTTSSIITIVSCVDNNDY